MLEEQISEKRKHFTTSVLYRKFQKTQNSKWSCSRTKLEADGVKTCTDAMDIKDLGMLQSGKIKRLQSPPRPLC